ncbi:MAG: hypothetical protein MUF21_04470 [Gemmatimonadaceae bacterium]|jgi:hypothetical protein|nr:hypothetical protein [Gemmatimonadaceae bacterium]
MDESAHGRTPTIGAQWAGGGEARARAGLQRLVDRLVAELAPERGVTRAERPVAAIECHRTPRGCILQSATSAVSVSWFPDREEGGTDGELHIASWRGTLSHPAAARRVAGAVLLQELVLRPECGIGDAWAWRDGEGTLHANSGMVAICRGLLATAMHEAAVPTTDVAS